MPARDQPLFARALEYGFALQRRFLGRVVRVGLSGVVHSLIHSELAEDTAELPARLASAVIRPRAEPAAELAALSHMLMKGFFFNQGLGMSISDVYSPPY